MTIGINPDNNITYKNIHTMLKTDYRFGEVYPLVSQVGKDASRVEFKDIMSNDNGGVALLSFCEGQELSKHQAPAEVMVCVLEGDVVFTMADKPLNLHKGDFLLMGNGVSHSVKAQTDARIMLIKIKHD